jgi:hypothetical protein
VQDTAPYDRFTRLLVDAIQDARLTDRVTIQSFDWRTILLAALSAGGRSWQRAPRMRPPPRAF